MVHGVLNLKRHEQPQDNHGSWKKNIGQSGAG